MVVKLPVKDWNPELSADLIKEYEGFRSEAYLCPAGVWTIGYGHTAGVKKGDKITKEQGDKYLAEDLISFQKDLASIVKVPLTQGMFIALMSFIYNFGVAKCKGYSLFKVLNEGKYYEASEWFGKYVMSGGTKLAGLVKRREAERQEFIKDGL